MNQEQTVAKGIFGLTGAGIAVIAESQHALEAIKYWIPWGLGVAVATASLISIGLDIRRKLKGKS